MNLKIYAILGIIIAGLGGGLYYQIKQNGILEQAKAQAEQSLKDEIKESAQRLARAAETNKLLADTQRQYRVLDKYALGLANDLENQDGECTNTSIPDSVINRVREYRAASESGNGA